MLNKNQYHNGRFSSNGYRGDASSYQNSGRAADANDDELNLIQLFIAMWRQKWLILGCIALCGFIAGIIAFSATPIYQSSGSLLIYQPQNKLSSLGLDGGMLGSIMSNNYGIGLGTTVANQMQVLRSRTLSLNIADSLMKERLMPDGEQYPILFKDYPGDDTMASQDTIALHLQEKLIFEKAGNGADVINITYESPSALASGRVVNIALSEFNKLSNRQKRTSVNSTTSFLKKEQAAIQDSLEVAEENIRRFMNEHKLVQVDAQTREIIEQMAVLEARRQESRAKLVAVSSGIEQYQNELNNIKPGLAEQYSEAVGPDISRLQYAKSELELQKQQLLAQNPNMDESSSRIAGLNRKIMSFKERIRELTQNLINKSDQYLGFLGSGGEVAQRVSQINQKLIELQVEKKQYQSQVEVISTQLEAQNRFFNNLPDNIVAFAKLKRDVKINETLYEMISKQYAQTSIQERSQFGLGHIIDNGYTPEIPEKPNKMLYIVLGLIVGGILGVGYVFTDVAFLGTIKGTQRMKKLGAPLLAVIPAVDRYKKNKSQKGTAGEVEETNISPALVTFVDPDSPASETYRDLENNLIYSRDVRPKSIGITSSGQGEGKSTTVANLGVVLAEAGHKVICVDADFRRPNLYQIFGLTATPGITEVLNRNALLKDHIQNTSVPGLFFLSTGHRPDKVAATIKGDPFLNLIKNLEKQYDFVFIDMAPFGAITDSALLLKQTDGVAVVAKFGETKDVKLNQTIEKLYNLNVNVLGTVLTAYNYTKSNDAYPASDYYKKQYQEL